MKRHLIAIIITITSLQALVTHGDIFNQTLYNDGNGSVLYEVYHNEIKELATKNKESMKQLRSQVSRLKQTIDIGGFVRNPKLRYGDIKLPNGAPLLDVICGIYDKLSSVKIVDESIETSMKKDINCKLAGLRKYCEGENSIKAEVIFKPRGAIFAPKRFTRKHSRMKITVDATLAETIKIKEKYINKFLKKCFNSKGREVAKAVAFTICKTLDELHQKIPSKKCSHVLNLVAVCEDWVWTSIYGYAKDLPPKAIVDAKKMTARKNDIFNKLKNLPKYSNA